MRVVTLLGLPCGVAPPSQCAHETKPIAATQPWQLC